MVEGTVFQLHQRMLRKTQVRDPCVQVSSCRRIQLCINTLHTLWNLSLFSPFPAFQQEIMHHQHRVGGVNVGLTLGVEERQGVSQDT